MAFNINEFKARGLRYLGARPTQFSVDIFVPLSSPDTERIRFVCRAASIPAMTVDKIPVPYFGRKINVPGDREFSDWNVTILNDDDFAIRNLMEKWSNQINALISNRMDPALYPALFKSTAIVTQYAKTGAIVKAYQVQGIWPINVDAIPLDWDATNQIEQFDVTFAIDSWIPDETSAQSPNDYNPVLSDDGIES